MSLGSTNILQFFIFATVSFIVAVAWNEAILSFFRDILFKNKPFNVPERRFIYAISITILSIIVLYIFSKFFIINL